MYAVTTRPYTSWHGVMNTMVLKHCPSCFPIAFVLLPASQHVEGPHNRTPIAETGEAAEVSQVRANSPCSRTPLANGSATVTTLLHPGTELQEEPEEAAINEGNLEAHLAGSGSSTPPSEEGLHMRVSAVPRQSESQVAHDSLGTSGRRSSMPALMSHNDTVTGSSVTDSDLELQLDGNTGHTHVDYLLNPWKWQHWSAVVGTLVVRLESRQSGVNDRHTVTLSVYT